jgi:hypothetical protein
MLFMKTSCWVQVAPRRSLGEQLHLRCIDKLVSSHTITIQGSERAKGTRQVAGYMMHLKIESERMQARLAVNEDES